MKHFTIAFAAVAGLFLATADAAPPIEVYGELPGVSDIAISPDGAHFALITRQDGETLFVVRKSGGDFVGGAKAGGIKARYVTFPTDNFAIFHASETASPGGWGVKWEQSAAYSFGVTTGKLALLLKDQPSLDLAQRGLGRIVGRLDGADTLFLPALTYQGTSASKYNLLRVEAGETSGRIHEKGMVDTYDWFIDGKGVVQARVDADEEADIFRVLTKRDGAWNTVYEEKRRSAAFRVEGLARGGGAIVISAEYESADNRTARLLEFSGETRLLPFADPRKIVKGAVTDHTRTVLGVEYAGLVPTYDFADRALDAEVKALMEGYPEDAVTFKSMTDDANKLLFHISGGKTPPGYFLFDREAGTITRIASEYSSLTEKDIAPVTSIVYPARDGLKITALLTRPPQTPFGQKSPLIVMPHGGPHAYDALGFDWLAQFFASRGYLVFQPNFRGSDGFGVAFREAGYREWGGKMQDDITDGVNLLIKKGWAQPQRVCIIGASYGGFAALAGGAFTPDLYQCVAAIAPVSDLVAHVDSLEKGDAGWTGVWAAEHIGDREKDRDMLRERSPIEAAENFTAPVLLIHGVDDTIVPFKHSERIEAALKQAGKEVTLVKLKNEDHWLSQSETRLQTLRELDKFVAVNIGPK